METAKPAAPGYLASLRTFADGLLGGVRDRIALFAVELQEEKCRLIQSCIWVSAIVFTGLMALGCASVTVVYLFWESARLAVLVGLTALYAGALLAIVFGFRRFLARQPRPFAATLDALAADRACIQNVN